MVLFNVSIGEAAGICSWPIGLKSPDSIRFFAATFPFSFFRNLGLIASLAGEKKDERRNTEMSRMRQSKCLEVRYGKQLSHRLCLQKLHLPFYETLGTAKRRAQMPDMWWSKTLERWKQVFTVRRKRQNSALALQGLRISVFRKKSYSNITFFPFFFFKEESV